MGSSGEDPSKGIDASAGSLVWVRRRNGSWWPGKILGPDELPEGCVPTPRSGTPVKLLGRDDASVDWYNLEKSKRVKAFHCGEYDNCIEKVKASASHLSKKGVKYARREDAILHALKLESARLGNDFPDSSTTPVMQFLDHHHVDDSTSALLPSEECEDDIDEDLNSSGDDSDEQHHVDPAKEESEPLRNPNDSEDDGAGAKRMKGLEDLGMGVESLLKRKRSQAAHINELLKRKNRRRTLTKVLESTTMVTVPVVCDQLSRQTGSSELVESNDEPNKNIVFSNNSDSNGISCENGALPDASFHVDDDDDDDKLGVPESGSSQRLFDVHLVAEEKCPAGLSSVFSDASQQTQVGAKAHSSQSSHVETLSLGNEDQNECGSGSTSSGTMNANHIISQTIEKGTTKWQSKGKRNSRSRKVDIDDEAEIYAPDVDRVSYHVKTRPITEIQVEDFHGWSWNAPQRESSHVRGSTIEMPVPQRLLPYRQSRFTVNPKYDSSDFSLSHHIASPSLFDVTVKVKSDYRPQGVPYISLMSKSSGRPVVGHPLAIEVLDDGSCDDLVKFAAECYNSSSELDHKVSADVSHPEGSRKRKPRGRPPTNPRSFTRSRSPKSKKNVLLSKKTRKLSSLTGSHRLSREGKKKPVVEKPKGPSIACVPLNVVFSRINAALNSSVRPVAHPNPASSA